VVLKSRDAAEEAVASNQAREESDEPTDVSSKGTLELEGLGMTVRNLDSKVKKEYGVENGVLVENVEPMSESNKRGLTASDVIVSVGDQNVSSVSQFDKLLKEKQSGDAVLMRVKGKDRSMRFVAIEVPGK
jgi:serine protease Do